MIRPALTTLIFLLGLLTSARPAAAKKDAAEAERTRYVRSYYSKFEHRIPMRDGARLFTAVYQPNDRTKRYPILLLRTPYRAAPYGVDRYPPALGPYAAFERAGYIFVYQEVRGTFLSEGTFVNMRPQLRGKHGPKAIDESTDTYDTIDWLLKHVPGHNGRVGLRGVSYPGFYAMAGAINGHPALKATSPQAPIADWFWDDVHHHGAFVLSLGFNFLSLFGVKREGPQTNWPEHFDFGTPDGYQFFLDLGPLKNVEKKYFKRKIPFWTEITKHPNYDEFWQSRSILPHLRGIKAATLIVGGWYDAEDLFGPLKIYRATTKLSPRADTRLVMGPWTHGGWTRGAGKEVGDSEFGFSTSKFYQDQIELPFFEHHLKGKKQPALPKAYIFETGANRWRSFDAWPPRQAKESALYLHSEGKLAWSRPSAATDARDSFVSDPHKPVPYTMKIGTRWSKGYMGEDQRFAAWRPDVLVYTSDVLKQDITIAGPIQATLFVSTTGTAADWVVKVIDVQPGRLAGEGEKHVSPRGGQQLLVRAGVIRGRFRESYATPKPFTPNEVTKVAFELLDVLHTFKRGHRIMVQVQSTWFPLIDRNPQRYVPNIFEASAGDFIKATHRVHRSARTASRIQFSTLP
jgi:putative CocE/NonD family hydrolase